MASLLTYATWATKEMGWYVAPVKGKVSYIWHTQASQSGADLYEWFGPDSKAGYTGYVVCLKKSHLMVIDVDSEDEPLPGHLGETLTVQTSEKYKLHFYYEDTEGLSKYLPKGGKWGQYKGAHGDEGGYVVGPGSLHPSGVLYTPLGWTKRTPSKMPKWARELALDRKEEAEQIITSTEKAGFIPLGLEEFITEDYIRRELEHELEQLLSIELGSRSTYGVPCLVGIIKLTQMRPDVLTLSNARKIVWAHLKPTNRKRDPQYWNEQELIKRWKWAVQSVFNEDGTER